jgi:hypothetical protein
MRAKQNLPTQVSLGDLSSVQARSYLGTTLEYLALGMDRRLGDPNTLPGGRRGSRSVGRPVSVFIASHNRRSQFTY